MVAKSIAWRQAKTLPESKSERIEWVCSADRMCEQVDLFIAQSVSCRQKPTTSSSLAVSHLKWHESILFLYWHSLYITSSLFLFRFAICYWKFDEKKSWNAALGSHILMDSDKMLVFNKSVYVNTQRWWRAQNELSILQMCRLHVVCLFVRILTGDGIINYNLCLHWFQVVIADSNRSQR